MPVANHTAASGAAQFAMRRSHLFVVSSLLAALGALLALEKMAWVFCLGVALILFLSALMLGSGRKGALALTFSFLLLFFLGQDRLAKLSPGSRDLCQLRANVVSFSGRVESCKIKDADKGRFVTAVVVPERLVLPWSKELGGKVLVHIGPFTEKEQVVPTWAGKYIFTGRLIKPRARVFSFEFDEQRWLALQDIYCQVSCTAADIQKFGQERGSQSEERGNQSEERRSQSEERRSQSEERWPP
jgi:hypothetical protein